MGVRRIPLRLPRAAPVPLPCKFFFYLFCPHRKPADGASRPEEAPSLSLAPLGNTVVVESFRCKNPHACSLSLRLHGQWMRALTSPSSDKLELYRFLRVRRNFIHFATSESYMIWHFARFVDDQVFDWRTSYWKMIIRQFKNENVQNLLNWTCSWWRTDGNSFYANVSHINCFSLINSCKSHVVIFVRIRNHTVKKKKKKERES